MRLLGDGPHVLISIFSREWYRCRCRLDHWLVIANVAIGILRRLCRWLTILTIRSHRWRFNFHRHERRYIRRSCYGFFHRAIWQSGIHVGVGAALPTLVVSCWWMDWSLIGRLSFLGRLLPLNQSLDVCRSFRNPWNDFYSVGCAPLHEFAWFLNQVIHRIIAQFLEWQRTTLHALVIDQQLSCQQSVGRCRCQNRANHIYDGFQLLLGHYEIGRFSDRRNLKLQTKTRWKWINWNR